MKKPDKPKLPEKKPSGEPEQAPLFDAGERWENEWKGMPEFVQEDLKPFHSVIVHFETRKDMEEFALLLKQKIEITTRSIWHPELEIISITDKRWVTPDSKKADLENPRERNEFIKAAEASKIDTKQWTQLLSDGWNFCQLEQEQLDPKFIERYGVKMRHLRLTDYEEAREWLRSGEGLKT